MVKVASQWETDELFTKYYWDNLVAIWKKMKLEPYLLLYTKLNFKWINNLNVKNETKSSGEKNVVKFLDKLQVRKTFLTANENPEAIELN